MPDAEEDDEGGVRGGIPEEGTRRHRRSRGGEYGIPFLVRGWGGAGKVVGGERQWSGWEFACPSGSNLTWQIR